MPKWKDLKRFLDRDGWELVRTGKYYFYRKKISDNEYLYIRVSKSSGEIKPGQWKDILKNQLHVTQEYFNSKI